MFASFRTISFSFEAVRGEYLSRTQKATQRPAILSMLQMEIYGKPYVRRIYIYRRGRGETSQCGARSGSPQLCAHILGRCLQHRGGEPEQAKGADGMQLFALDCIAHIVDAEMDQVFACMNDM